MQESAAPCAEKARTGWVTCVFSYLTVLLRCLLCNGGGSPLRSAVVTSHHTKPQRCSHGLF